MKIRLNGLDYGETETREEFLNLLNQLKKDQIVKGRVLVSANVDGEDITIQELLQREFPEDTEVDIKSSDARQMITEALEQSLEYIPVLQKHLPLIAEGLRSGEVLDVMNVLSKAIEGIMWLNRIISYSIRIMGAIEPDIIESAIGKDIRDFTEEEVRLKGVFDDLSVALEDGDFLRVADAIDYEVLPWLKNYEDMIKGVNAYINRSDN